MAGDLLPYQRTDKGIRLRVRAQPQAKANRITGLRMDANGRASLIVQVTAAPEKGKANTAIQKLLAKSVGIAKTDIELITGDTNRDKVFLIADPEETLTKAIDLVIHNK